MSLSITKVNILVALKDIKILRDDLKERNRGVNSMNWDSDHPSYVAERKDNDRLNKLENELLNELKELEK